MSTTERRCAPLPDAPGYTAVLGVPTDVLERLRALRLAARNGALSLEEWRARHDEALAGHEPDVDGTQLGQLIADTGAAATAAQDDVDRWLFLSGLLEDLELLTTPQAYEPGTRMLLALRVGTLEETYRWLRAAVDEQPDASVQDLLTRAAIESADAKLALDRYDAQ